MGSPLAMAIRDHLMSQMSEQNEAQMDAYRQEIQELYKQLRSQNQDTWSISPRAAAGCLLMPDGGHYCAPKPSSVLPDISQSTSTTIYARADKNGSSQIYIGSDGQELQLSAGGNNMFPALDPITRDAVWQTDVNGVWQVVLYDSAVGTSTIIASSSGPQTNPQIYGGRIVWQQWSDNNWEIFLAEPTAGLLANHTVRKITENPAHDMFPSIAGGILTWQRLTQEGWRTVAYDLLSNKEAVVNVPGGKQDKARVGILFERTENGFTDYWFYDVAAGTVARVGDTTPHTQIPTPVFVTITRAVQPPKIETTTSSPATPTTQ
jgi:beta propeller repeat protein